MMGGSMRKMLVFLMAFSILQFVYAQPENGKSDTKNDADSISKEAKAKVAKVAEVESALEKLSQKALTEKDVKWKVCLDEYVGTFKGVALGAVNAGSKVDELVRAGKTEEANNQLILLRGLAESAEKTLAESQTCERQLTSVDAKSSTVKEINSKMTGTVDNESVNDSMGVGFGSEFVADTDKSVVSGSDLADAGGVDSSDVSLDSPGVSGGDTESQTDIIDIVDTPEVIDVSPTK